MTNLWNLYLQRVCLGAAVLAFSLHTAAQAADFEGFTAPYRNIDVAASDSGTVEKLDIKEGDQVKADQVLGNLNLEVLQATLEIADKTRNGVGKLRSAEADLRLKTDRLAKLQLLLERKHATQEEVDKTAVEKEIAEAQLLTVKEEMEIRQLEHARIQTQIDLRMLRSPIDGVVTRIDKDQGEFVSPTDPVVLNVVQLDPLICVFSVPHAAAKQLKAEGTVPVLISEQRTKANGTIELISPVIDPQSGTVQIKVRLANPQQEYRSGDKCWLTINGVAEQPQQAEAPAKPVPQPVVPRAALTPVLPAR